MDTRISTRDAFDPRDGVREAQEIREKLEITVRATRELVDRSKGILKKTQELLEKTPEK